jgi:hypothetical protein
MKIKAIITGVTGMVGEGVLHQCLHHPDIESVLVIGRRTCGIQHHKLQEILIPNFFDLTSVEHKLHGFNACYFCLGVSSVGMNEETYRRVTYDLTMVTARTLVKHNPEMTFCYISGLGTDSTEKKNIMWARVKGKTENDLLTLPFKAAYMFRPGFIKPIKGLKNTLKLVKIADPFFPVFKFFFPKAVVTLEHLGNAMINVTLNGFNKNILECEDITLAGNSLQK